MIDNAPSTGWLRDISVPAPYPSAPLRWPLPMRKWNAASGYRWMRNEQRSYFTHFFEAAPRQTKAPPEAWLGLRVWTAEGFGLSRRGRRQPPYFENAGADYRGRVLRHRTDPGEVFQQTGVRNVRRRSFEPDHAKHAVRVWLPRNLHAPVSYAVGVSVALPTQGRLTLLEHAVCATDQFFTVLWCRFIGLARRPF